MSTMQDSEGASEACNGTSEACNAASEGRTAAVEGVGERGKGPGAALGACRGGPRPPGGRRQRGERGRRRPRRLSWDDSVSVER